MSTSTNQGALSLADVDALIAGLNTAEALDEFARYEADYIANPNNRFARLWYGRAVNYRAELAAARLAIIDGVRVDSAMFSKFSTIQGEPGTSHP